jgi:DNA-binding transcriptional regulator YdaS (Cro superfamily)
MVNEIEKAALLEAIKILGSQKALAIALGVKPQTVFCWKKIGVPVRRAKQIEAATNYKVKKERLKPSIYS